MLLKRKNGQLPILSPAGPGYEIRLNLRRAAQWNGQDPVSKVMHNRYIEAATVAAEREDISLPNSRSYKLLV